MTLNLTLRQKQCLFLAAKGKTEHEIAAILNITRSTVATHMSTIYNIYELAGEGSRIRAILFAIKTKEFTIDDVFERDYTFLTGEYGQVKGRKKEIDPIEQRERKNRLQREKWARRKEQKVLIEKRDNNE